MSSEVRQKRLHDGEDDVRSVVNDGEISRRRALHGLVRQALALLELI